jgi:hypothetical protein
MATHDWVSVEGDRGSVLSMVNRKPNWGSVFLMVPVRFECSRCGMVCGDGIPTMSPPYKTCDDLVVSQVMES